MGSNDYPVYSWPAFKNKRDNPYNYLLYSCMDGIDVIEFDEKKPIKEKCTLHIHWPDRIFKSPNFIKVIKRYLKFRKRLKEAKSFGGCVIWTVHNIEPRGLDRKSLKGWLWRRFLRHIDAYIFMSKHSEKIFNRVYPELSDKPRQIIKHGHYQEYYPPSCNDHSETSGSSDASLNLLIFGKVVPHKGIESFIEVFSSDCLSLSGVNVAIVGKPSERRFSERLSVLASDDSRISMDFKHVEDSDISAVFGACSVVLLPYEVALNSGTALLGLSMSRPIIAPRMGAFTELQEDVGDEWVFLYDFPLQAQDLYSAVKWINNRNASTEPDLSAMEWSDISKSTLDFYRGLYERAE